VTRGFDEGGFVNSEVMGVWGLDSSCVMLWMDFLVANRNSARSRHDLWQGKGLWNYAISRQLT
jgi:hypothetical protein